jgi:hypothetical protein
MAAVKRDRDVRHVSVASPHRSVGRHRLVVHCGTVTQGRGEAVPQARGTGRIGKTPTTIGAIGSNESS